MKTFLVRWEKVVRADTPEDAARQAREYMIDPGTTETDFFVQHGAAGSGPAPGMKLIIVQDPDRSDE